MLIENNSVEQGRRWKLQRAASMFSAALLQSEENNKKSLDSSWCNTGAKRPGQQANIRSDPPPQPHQKMFLQLEACRALSKTRQLFTVNAFTNWCHGSALFSFFFFLFYAMHQATFRWPGRKWAPEKKNHIQEEWKDLEGKKHTRDRSEEVKTQLTRTNWGQTLANDWFSQVIFVFLWTIKELE